jgi:hypothetical protein
MSRALVVAAAVGVCLAAGAYVQISRPRAAPHASTASASTDLAQERGTEPSETPPTDDALASRLAARLSSAVAAVSNGRAFPAASSSPSTADTAPSSRDSRGTGAASPASARVAPVSTESAPAAEPPPEPRTADNDLSTLPAGQEMQANLVKQLKPILQSCYQDELARGTAQGETMGLFFHVSVVPNLGAVVHSVELEAGAIDPAFYQCIQESVGAVAPFKVSGPEETVVYIPLTFQPQQPPQPQPP